MATVPGSGFGVEGHLPGCRSATATETLVEALDHLEQFAAGWLAPLAHPLLT